MTSTPHATAPSGVILVIRTDDPELAYLGALGAIRGGIDAVEITLSVPDAFEVIRRLSTEGTRLGAGTILEPDQVDASVEAGASFIVSPEFNLAVLGRAHELNTPMIPGAITPTEVQHAYRSGADAVKLFPAGFAGGPAYLAELRGPLPHIPFVISGGVTLETAPQYFAGGAIAVCVGRDILDWDAVARGDLDIVAARTREFLAGAYAQAIEPHSSLPVVR